MKVRYAAAFFAVCLAVMFSAAFLSPPAEAGYSTGLSSKDIQIVSPDASGRSYDGKVTIKGISQLDRVWICLRGPNGEVITYFADVIEGRFVKDIWLRFGPGEYVFWAGNNPTIFDGKIRFIVINNLQDDLRYSSPSSYVDSDNPLVLELAVQITGNKATQLEKLQAIHDWVTSNIAYDCQAYISAVKLVPASQAILSKIGTCKNYSFVVAALARAAGLQSRIVIGDVPGTVSHAWNEVLVDGRWIPVDATWDAGFVQDGVFVPSATTKFFDPDLTDFAATHHPQSICLY